MTSPPRVIELQATPLEELESEVLDVAESVDESELSAAELDEEKVSLVEASLVEVSLVEVESKVDDVRSLFVFEESVELSPLIEEKSSEAVVEPELAVEAESVAVSVSLLSALALVSALFVLETCDKVSVVVEVVEPSPQLNAMPVKTAVLAKKTSLERVNSKKHARIECLSLPSGFRSAPSQWRG